MKQRSLKRMLAWQWALFAGALLLGIGALAALALWILEDSFIDARLDAVEQTLELGQALPAQVELMRLADFPPQVQTRLAALRPGAQREFRLDQDRYLHLRVLPADTQGARFAVVNAQDELRVSAGLKRAAPLLALLLLFVLLYALWLARRFVVRIENWTAGLLHALDGEANAVSLRAAADAQAISEFRRFGHGLADALEQRLAAMKREEDTLRFLAHELRTPLQSAALALAALDQADAPRARARLARALQRLERASAAVLWLGDTTPSVEPAPVDPILKTLVDEFTTLAERRGLSIRTDVDPALSWALPVAAIEAVIGNLLLNAIQHGAPGVIGVSGNADALTIRNPANDRDASPGFGLGIELARRLLAGINWHLEIGAEAGDIVVRLCPGSAANQVIPKASVGSG